MIKKFVVCLLSFCIIAIGLSCESYYFKNNDSVFTLYNLVSLLVFSALITVPAIKFWEAKLGK